MAPRVLVCIEDNRVALDVSTRLARQGLDCVLVQRPPALADESRNGADVVVVQDRFTSGEAVTSLLRQVRAARTESVPAVVLLTGPIQSSDRMILERQYKARTFLDAREGAGAIARAAAGAAGRVLADTGTEGTGIADTGTADTGTARTGTAGTGTAGTGTVDTSAARTITADVKNAALDDGPPSSGIDASEHARALDALAPQHLADHAADAFPADQHTDTFSALSPAGGVSALDYFLPPESAGGVPESAGSTPSQEEARPSPGSRGSPSVTGTTPTEATAQEGSVQNTTEIQMAQNELKRSLLQERKLKEAALKRVDELEARLARFEGSTRNTGDIPTEGVFEDIRFPALLARCRAEAFTGAISMQSAGATRTVYLRDGLPTAFHSSEPGERIGRILVTQGRITDEQYMKATTRSVERSIKLTDALIELGWMDAGTVVLEQRSLARDQIISSFELVQGRFTVREGAAPDGATPTFDFGPGEIYVQGYRRYAPAGEMNAVFETLRDTYLVTNARLASYRPKLGLTDDDERLLRLFGEALTVEEAVEQARITPEAAARLLSALLALELVEEWRPGVEQFQARLRTERQRHTEETNRLLKESRERELRLREAFERALGAAGPAALKDAHDDDAPPPGAPRTAPATVPPAAAPEQATATSARGPDLTMAPASALPAPAPPASTSPPSTPATSPPPPTATSDKTASAPSAPTAAPAEGAPLTTRPSSSLPRAFSSVDPLPRRPSAGGAAPGASSRPQIVLEKTTADGDVDSTRTAEHVASAAPTSQGPSRTISKVVAPMSTGDLAPAASSTPSQVTTTVVSSVRPPSAPPKSATAGAPPATATSSPPPLVSAPPSSAAPATSLSALPTATAADAPARPAREAPSALAATRFREGLEHAAQSRFMEAEVALREAVRIDARPDYLTALARVLLSNPRYERSGTLPVVKSLLDRAVQIAPDHTEAAELHAEVRRELGLA